MESVLGARYVLVRMYIWLGDFVAGFICSITLAFDGDLCLDVQAGCRKLVVPRTHVRRSVGTGTWRHEGTATAIAPEGQQRYQDFNQQAKDQTSREHSHCGGLGERRPRRRRAHPYVCERGRSHMTKDRMT